eukprot:SAG31_NODE_9516_length_1265_cov_1.874786_1_plen_161_part_00
MALTTRAAALALSIGGALASIRPSVHATESAHPSTTARTTPSGFGTKPHLWFVLVDDLGHADVGFTEHPPTVEIDTPTMDTLVAQGVRLERHYVHYTCTPTRSSIHSGRLPVHVTTTLSNPASPSAGIPRNYTGMAEVLRRGGYFTYFMGKWDAGCVATA